MDAGSIYVKIGAKLEPLDRAMREVNTKLKSFETKTAALAKKTEKLANAIIKRTALITAAIGGVSTAAVKVAGDFERAMVRVASVSQATGRQMGQLRKAALDLAGATEYTGRQVAEGMGFLAMAGFKVEQTIGAMPSVLQLATAGMMDLGSAADITTNILTGYGMEVDDLAKVNDILVSAMTGANVDLQMLGESFKYAGPVVKGAGIAFEEAAATIALMGNAGIQSTMAGTSLRTAVSRLLNPSKQAQRILGRLGVQTKDATGKMRSLTTIITELERAGATTADMMALFGERAGPAMAALVDQGSGALREFTARLRDSEGIAGKIERDMLNTWPGMWNVLKGQIEGVAITIGDDLLPYAKAVVTIAGDIVAKFQGLDKEQRMQILRWVGLAGATVGVIAAFGMVVAAAALVMKGFSMLAGVISILLSPLFIQLALISLAVGAVGKAWNSDWLGMKTYFLENIAPAIIDGLKGLTKNLDTITTGVRNIWDTVKEWKDKVVTWTVNLIKGAWETVSDWVDRAVAWVVNLAKGAYDAVKGWIDAVVTWAVDLVKGIATAVSDWLDKRVPWLVDLVKGAVDAVSDWVGRVVTWAVELVKGVYAAVSDWLSRVVTWAVELVKGAWKAVADWVVGAVTWAVDLVKGAYTAVAGWVDRVITWFVQLKPVAAASDVAASIFGRKATEGEVIARAVTVAMEMGIRPELLLGDPEAMAEIRRQLETPEWLQNMQRAVDSMTPETLEVVADIGLRVTAGVITWAVTKTLGGAIVGLATALGGAGWAWLKAVSGTAAGLSMTIAVPALAFALTPKIVEWIYGPAPEERVDFAEAPGAKAYEEFKRSLADRFNWLTLEDGKLRIDLGEVWIDFKIRLGKILDLSNLGKQIKDAIGLSDGGSGNIQSAIEELGWGYRGAQPTAQGLNDLSKVTAQLTEEQKHLIARMVQAEAATESFEGQVAVAAVILNRLQSRGFPNTVEGVLSQPNQFEPYLEGGRFHQITEANTEALKAVEAALSGWDPSGGALYFYNPEIVLERNASNWILTHTTPIKDIGSHRFAGHQSGTPWTGSGPLDEVAGVVHRREAVIPWDALRKGPAGVLEFLGVPGFAAGRGKGALGSLAAVDPGLAKDLEDQRTMLSKLTDSLMKIPEMLMEGMLAMFDLLGQALMFAVEKLFSKEKADELRQTFADLKQRAKELIESFSRTSEDAEKVGKTIAEATEPDLPAPELTRWQKFTLWLGEQIDQINAAVENIDWGKTIQTGLDTVTTKLQEADSVFAQFMGDLVSHIKVGMDEAGQIMIDWSNALASMLNATIALVAESLTSLLLNEYGSQFRGLTKQGKETFPDLGAMVKNYGDWDKNMAKLKDAQRSIDRNTVAGAGIGAALGYGIGTLIAGPLAGAIIGGFLGGTGARRASQQNYAKEIAELQEKLKDTWQSIKEALGTTVTDIADSLAKAFSADTYEGFVAQFSQSLEEHVRQALITAFMSSEAIRPLLDQLSDAVTEAVFDGVVSTDKRDTIIDLYSKITDKSEGFYNALKDLGIATEDVAEKMGAVSESLRNVPAGFKIATRRFQAANPVPLAEGGIVTRPTLALVGESGPEAVIPLGSGGSGITVEVTVNGNIYADDFDDRVSRAVAKGARKAGLGRYGLAGGRA